MGQLDKAGVNTDEVLGAMKKSVATLAKEGISASDGLAMYYEKIKNAGRPQRPPASRRRSSVQGQAPRWPQQSETALWPSQT